MAKNCLNKLALSVIGGCTINPVGVKSIYLMHAEDVKFTFTDNPRRIAAVTFADGARSYLVEGYKQNIQVNGSLKSLDAAASMDASVTFKIPHGPGAVGFVDTITTGRFYVLVLFNNTDQIVLGSTVPLECSAADFDSNANANMITITLATPEGAAGCHMVIPTNVARDTIISKSV
nr:MAG TPA: hypothetical protein [Caudoviricetes sp.]